jgi:hypothetical protein
MKAGRETREESETRRSNALQGTPVGISLAMATTVYLKEILVV